MTLYMASSAVVGRRPRMSRMRAYSSAFSPSSAQGCSSSGVLAAISTVSMFIARLRPRSAPRSLALPAMLARASFSRSCGDDRLQHAREEAQPVGRRTGEVLDGVLGVRHEADDAAVLARHARDVAQAAVRVAVDVADGDPAVLLEPLELVRRGHVASLAVLDRDEDALALAV